MYFICSEYLSYRVYHRVKIEIPRFIIPQQLTFCTRYTDVIDYALLREETGHNFSYTQNQEEIRRIQADLTVKDIFAYTPKEEEIIQTVRFRNRTPYVENICYSLDCMEYFRVSKFVYLEYVCYRILMKSKEFMDAYMRASTIERRSEKFNEKYGISYDSIAVTTVSPGVLYEVVFTTSSQLGRSNLLAFTVTNPMRNPYRSLKVAGTHDRGYNPTDNSVALNTFTSSHYKFYVTSLPPPYPTRCLVYEKFRLADIPNKKLKGKTECTEECMKFNLMRIRKLPFSLMIHEPVNYKIVSYKDCLDANISKILFETREYCEAQCSFHSCLWGMSIIKTIAIDSEEFSFKFVLPPHPTYQVDIVPRFNAIEFFTDVSNSLSAWTGLYIMGLKDKLFDWLMRKTGNIKDKSIDLKKRKRSFLQDIPKESRRLYVQLVIKNILTAVDIVNARITRLEECHEVRYDSDAGFVVDWHDRNEIITHRPKSKRRV